MTTKKFYLYADTKLLEQDDKKTIDYMIGDEIFLIYYYGVLWFLGFSSGILINFSKI